MAQAVTVAKWTGYVLVALLAVVIALASMRFLTFNPLVLDEFLRPNLIDHPIPFYLHVTLAPIALIIGVWQFLPVTRRSAWHRWEGRIYVVCVLAAAVSGFIVAFTTVAGPVHATGSQSSPSSGSARRSWPMSRSGPENTPSTAAG